MVGVAAGIFAAFGTRSAVTAAFTAPIVPRSTITITAATFAARTAITATAFTTTAAGATIAAAALGTVTARFARGTGVLERLAGFLIDDAHR